MSGFLWSRPDGDGVQFCAVHESGEIVQVRDHGVYAELSTFNSARPRFEHFASAQLAREAGERHLEEQGVTP